MDEKLIGQFGFSLSQVGINAKELARHELGDEIFEKLKQHYEQ
jgi:preprotein translocase subunit SecA